jgi:hypothetical protein
MDLDSAKTGTEVRTPEPAVPRPLRRGQAELFASHPTLFFLCLLAL